METRFESSAAVLCIIREVIKGEIKPDEFTISIRNDKMLYGTLSRYSTNNLEIRYQEIPGEIEFREGSKFKLVVKPENIISCSYNQTYGKFSVEIEPDIEEFHKKLFSGFYDEEDMV